MIDQCYAFVCVKNALKQGFIFLSIESDWITSIIQKIRHTAIRPRTAMRQRASEREAGRPYRPQGATY